jgi:hypothetical protein
MWRNSIVAALAMSFIACTEQTTTLDAAVSDAFVNPDAGTIADAGEEQDSGVEASSDAGFDAGLDASVIVDSGVLVDTGVNFDANVVTDSGSLDAAPVDAADATTRSMFVDLIVQLREFHRFNGTTVQLFTHDTFENRFYGPATGTLVEGQADLRIPNGFGRDLFGQVGYLWLDRPGDLMCTDGVDPVYLFNINNDLATGPLIVEVRLSDEPVMIDECGPFTSL